MQNSIYVGHGTPTNAIEKGKYQTDLKNYVESIDKPDAIVVVSAHWENYLPLYITGAEHPGIIYDFGGFPEEMYNLRYDSPGNPKLAASVKNKFDAKGIDSVITDKRGLDHGAWVPLLLMYPEADIPVVQISMPIPRGSEALYKMGQALIPLRDQNILLMGSGNLVHNIPYAMRQFQLGKVDFGYNNPTENWAAETDEWIKDKLDNLEINQILKASEKSPNFKLAAPTTEHFDPIYFTMGTLNDGEGVNHFHESFQAGSFSMRSFALTK